MSGPQRKPDQTAISVSMSKEMLAQMDARAKALGLNRSQYIAQLARADLLAKGALVIQDSAQLTQPAQPVAKPVSYSQPSTNPKIAALADAAVRDSLTAVPGVPPSRAARPTRSARPRRSKHG